MDANAMIWIRFGVMSRWGRMWRMAVEDKSRRSVISTLQSRTPPLSSRIQEAGIKYAMQEASIFGDLLIDHQMRSKIVEIHSDSPFLSIK